MTNLFLAARNCATLLELQMESLNVWGSVHRVGHRIVVVTDPTYVQTMTDVVEDLKRSLDGTGADVVFAVVPTVNL